MASVTGSGDSPRIGSERWSDRSSESAPSRGSRGPLAPARRPAAPVPLAARSRAGFVSGGGSGEALAPRAELPARRTEDATLQERDAAGRHALRQQVLEAGETAQVYGHQTSDPACAPVAAMPQVAAVSGPMGPAAAVLQALMRQALRLTTQALRDELATPFARLPARRAAPAA